SIPDHILSSPILTGNDLGKLAGQLKLPTDSEIASAAILPEVQSTLTRDASIASKHYLAKTFLDRGDVSIGFSILLI
ncbi:MAG: hypothetical protein M3R25_15495, partial [Bacteroidota bacterium]|nr:hypothetical protein [Bacteroidota bacterium]